MKKMVEKEKEQLSKIVISKSKADIMTDTQLNSIHVEVSAKTTREAYLVSKRILKDNED